MPANNRPRDLPELADLYGLTGLIAWADSDGVIVAGQNMPAGREGWTRISRERLDAAPEPWVLWYFAVEHLADELRVDVDRAAIKAKALIQLREMCSENPL